MTAAEPAMTDAEIVNIIATIRAAHPDLAPDGFFIASDRRPRHGPDDLTRKERHIASRATMTRPERVAEFRTAWEFLTADGGPLLTRKINTHGTSYGWKHRAEEWVRDNRPDWPGKTYCSNGIFIVAAIHAGCLVERTAPDDPNAFVNLSMRMAPMWERRFPHGRRWRDRTVRGRTAVA